MSKGEQHDGAPIILITTDQQRYDAVGGEGPEYLRTPHYDFLRRCGVEYRGYADCPICVPSRLSIMSGESVFRHGESGFPPSQKVLESRETLPEVMRRAGYRTAAIGKMHFEPERARHGFEEMILPDDYYREMRGKGTMEQPMRHGLGQTEMYPGMSTVGESSTLTSWIAEKSLEYIEHRRDPLHPFFLWCSFTKPHPPLDPPEPYYSMYRNEAHADPWVGDWAEGEDCPELFKRRRERGSHDKLSRTLLREAKSAYYGLVTQIDYNMGRILAALDGQDLLDKCWIIYTSDHGELLGDHRNCGKGFMYEGSARVPFLIKPPKGYTRAVGRRTRSLASMCDILPTLAEITGVSCSADVDGTSLLDAVKDPDAEPRTEVCGGQFANTDSMHTALIKHDRKLVYYSEGSNLQYFDLEKDPHELNNLVQDEAKHQEVELMKKELIQYLTNYETPLLDKGKLAKTPVVQEPENERRASAHLGLHTECWPHDVRH